MNVFVAPKNVIPCIAEQEVVQPKVKLYDYEMSDVEARICESVEKTHPQLFPLIDFGLVMMQARMGEMQFAPKALGKSVAHKSMVNSVDGIVWMMADPGFTPGYLGDPKNKEVLETLLTQPVELVIDDLTGFFTTGTILTSFVFIAQLVYTKSWYGRVRGQPVLQHVDLGVLASGTYWCAAQAVTMGIWSSHVSDRFIRLYPVYYRHPVDFNQFCVSHENPPKFQYSYVPHNVNKMGWVVDIDLEKKCIELLMNQVTERRAVLYTKNILAAHAAMCGRDIVTDDDAKWLLLFSPFIRTEPLFSVRKIVRYGKLYQSEGIIYSDVIPEVLFWVGFRPGKISDYCKYSHFPKTVVQDVLNYLKRLGFVTEKDGVWDYAGQYRDEILHLYKCLGVGE